MESKTNIINFQAARKRRKIQRVKTWFMKPTVLAFLIIFVIYGLLIGGYLADTDTHSYRSLVNSKVEMDTFHPNYFQKIHE